MARTLIGNIKGPKGDTGGTGPAGPKGDKGETGGTGPQGQRGTHWTQGTKITGTSTTATIFSGSGITAAIVDDCYLNTSTGNTYRCTVAGPASTAKWVYTGNIKGPKGDTGATGPTGPKGEKGETGAVENLDAQIVTFAEAAEALNIQSGDTVATVLGKLLKFQNTQNSNWANLISDETIAAAQAAGIDLSGGGVLNLNRLVQLFLTNPVVEEYDTADGWHVIKYADGRAEATIAKYIASATFTASGYIAIYAHNFALPNSLFVSTPQVWSTPSSNAGIWSCGSSGTTKDRVYFYDFKPSAGAGSYSLNVLVKGRYK
ncbi:MAG: hypothetical protein SOR93_03470 [Clostridiales Family XIII bacterium]|nr:hypothetical protein [Clostridiales Family XIII bacterium]